MNNLFKQLQPITKNLHFIKGNINEITSKFIEWQTPLIAENMNKFSVKPYSLNLKNTLFLLFPLNTTERRRYLFIPCKNNWTAFFDNGYQGSDSGAPNVIGDILKTEVIVASYNYKTEETLFSLFDYSKEENGLIRSVGVYKENNWKFHTYGSKLIFENENQLLSKKTKERFNFKTLEQYLSFYKIYAYENDFYINSETIFIEKIGPQFSSNSSIELNTFL